MNNIGRFVFDAWLLYVALALIGCGKIELSAELLTPEESSFPYSVTLTAEQAVLVSGKLQAKLDISVLDSKTKQPVEGLTPDLEVETTSNSANLFTSLAAKLFNKSYYIKGAGDADGTSITCSVTDEHGQSICNLSSDPGKTSVLKWRGAPAAKAVTMIFYPPPKVESLSHSEIPFDLGLDLTVTGESFREGTSVQIQGQSCISILIVDPNTLRCRLPALTMGPKDIRIQAPDMQETTVEEALEYKDLSGPTISVSNSPNALNNQTNYNISFSATDNVTIPSGLTLECKKDSDLLYSPCTSPFSWTNPSDGNRSLSIRARDGAGNETVRSITWTRDTQAPSGSIVVNGLGVSPSTNSNSRSLTFSGPSDAVAVKVVSVLITRRGT